MFKLPFYIDSPLLVSGFTSTVAIALLLYLQADRHNWRIAIPFKRFCDLWAGALPTEQRYRRGSGLLIILMILFAINALFGLIVASGLVKNGDPQPTITMDQFNEERQRPPG